MTLSNIKQKLISLFSNNLYAMSLYARQIAGTLVLFLIARYITVYDYGLFTSYKTLSTFILVLANMGYESYILVSSQNNEVQVKQKIALFILNALLLLFIVLCALPFSCAENKLLFGFVFVRTFLDGTFFALILPYFQASRKLKTISVINIIYAVLIMVIAIISFVLKLSIIKFLSLNIFIGLVNFIQCSVYARIPYCNILKNLNKAYHIIDSQIISYMVINICFILYSQIQAIFVSTQTHKESAALYFAANTIAGVAMLLVGAQTQKLLPEFIDVSGKDVELLLKQEVKKICYITFSIFVFFIFLGKNILQILYGQAYYAEAYNILLILNFANIFYAIGKIYITFIMAKSYTNVIWKMQIVSILISIITICSTYKYGIYSAALSYLLSVLYIGYAYWKKTRQIICKQGM